MKRVMAGVWMVALVGVALLAGPGAGPAGARAPGPGTSPGAVRTVKFYVVEAADEVLFQVARKTLPGDSDLRSQEIFELNKGRTQPDGQRLVDPDLLAPGWLLELPPDARGASVRVGAVPGPSLAVTSAAVDGSALARYSVPLYGGSVAVVLLAGAGLLLRRRHLRLAPAAGPTAGPTATGPDTDRRGPGSTRPARARWLPRLRARRSTSTASVAALAGVDATALADRALAGLAAACAATGRPIPRVHSLLLDQRSLRLRLAPADDQPPAPWRAADRGGVWELDRRDVSPSPGVAPPYPLLILVGATRGTLVAVNLAQATGVIALAGDPRYARAFAATLARRLTDRAGDAVTRVTVAGFGGSLAPPANRAVWHEPAGVWHEPAGDAAGPAGFAAGPAIPLVEVTGVDELLTGPAATGSYELLVLGEAPTDPARAAALVQLASQPGQLVVVVGDLPGARWRWLIAEDGAVDLVPLDLRVDVPALDGPAKDLLATIDAR